jgi:hypothetical protein
MTLKELRIWHWQKLLQARLQQRKHEEKAETLRASAIYRQRVQAGHSDITARSYQRTASLHLGAVQALNDSLPGTAEQDLFEESLG